MTPSAVSFRADPPRPRPAVLVVEDDVDLRSALADVLRDDGFEVAVVGDGRAAMAALHEGFAADLILLDLFMPGMNGWEFRALQRSERDPAIASIPVVVVSGHGNLDGAGLDAVAFLRKPLGLQALGALRELADDARAAAGRRPSATPAR
jgi:CheY-like chemotaxis protein